MAAARFWICDFSFCIDTTMPVGRWVIRTAESVVLTDWPPGPEERKTSTRISFSGISISSVLLHERDDLDAGEARLAPALAVERADPHEAVGAGLDGEVCRRRRARRPRRSRT